MKKKFLAIFGISCLALGGVISSVLVGSTRMSGFINGANTEYKMTLDKTNAPGDLSDSEYTREAVAEEVIVKGDYTLSMKYRLAKLENDHHVQLAPHGYMYNEIDSSDYDNRIAGLTYIKVNYTSEAQVTIRTSIRNDGKEFSTRVVAESGVPVTLTHSPYYFIIEAGDKVAHITSVDLGYSCQENPGYDLFSLQGTYSGLGDDGYRYLLNVNSSSVTISSLDNPTPMTVEGVLSLSGNKISCVFNLGGNTGKYTCQISTDHRELTFVSKEGVCALFPSISFYKVYNVENFEEYTAQGDGFGGQNRGADSLYDMSGLRAAYHSDWYTTNNYAVSYLGDTGWKVMGSTDFLSYTANKGFNSTKAAAFKGNSNGLRYIQFSGLQGIPTMIGKGSYLSFKAKAYSNSSLTTVKTTDTAIKVYGFFNQQITKSNLTSVRTSVDVTIPANSDWATYTIALDSSKTYYSYGIYINTPNTVYLVLDDVTIYTVNPYKPTAVTGVSVSPTTADLVTGGTTQLTATVAPLDATNKNVTWSSNNTTVANVSDKGLVTAYSSGTAVITAKTVDGAFTATCTVNVTGQAVAPYPSGTFKSTIALENGNITVVFSIGTKQNGLVAVLVNNKDIAASSISYNDTTQSFDIVTTGSTGGIALGTISGTFDDQNDKLINISSSTIQNLPAFAATRVTVWDCDGTTAELQSLFKRRYNTGSWNVDNTNADRITSNTTEFVSGTGSVKRRGYGSGAVALNFNADFSPAKTVSNVHYWVYNPSNNDIALRMWIYKGTALSSNKEIGGVTAKANQWTYVAMGFDSASIYNLQIADFNNTGVYLSFDNIALF